MGSCLQLAARYRMLTIPLERAGGCSLPSFPLPSGEDQLPLRTNLAAPLPPNPWPHKGADRMNAHPYRRGLEVLFKPLSFCLGGTAQAALSIPSPILHHDSICLVKKTHYHKTPLGNKPQHIHLAPSITFAVTRSVLYHYSKPQQSHFSTRN